MTIALAVLYVFLVCARARFAVRHARVFEAESLDEPVTIVQPVLSGDPLLEQTLRANLEAHTQAEFLWMIDEDDPESQRIGACGMKEYPNLRVMVLPGPRDGENPKLAKLIQALPLVHTARMIVLDDDTILPAGSRLPAGPLVTGLPVFAAKGSVYERLIGGFVNGSALLTYLPAAHLKLQKSINGMIYAVDTEQLGAMGGFAAAGHALTDDYAVASLYARHGLGITQATKPAMVAMTVVEPKHYVRVMRRWMIFASLYFQDNLSLRTAFWIGLPGVLPLAGLIAGVVHGYGLFWVVLLFGKAVFNRMLLWKITGVSSSAVDCMFEVVADLLLPIWMVVAFIQPNRLTWRNRRIEMSGGEIRYR